MYFPRIVWRNEGVKKLARKIGLLEETVGNPQLSIPSRTPEDTPKVEDWKGVRLREYSDVSTLHVRRLIADQRDISRLATKLYDTYMSDESGSLSTFEDYIGKPKSKPERVRGYDFGDTVLPSDSLEDNGQKENNGTDYKGNEEEIRRRKDEAFSKDFEGVDEIELTEEMIIESPGLTRSQESEDYEDRANETKVRRSYNQSPYELSMVSGNIRARLSLIPLDKDGLTKYGIKTKGGYRVSLSVRGTGDLVNGIGQVVRGIETGEF